MVFPSSSASSSSGTRSTWRGEKEKNWRTGQPGQPGQPGRFAMQGRGSQTSSNKSSSFISWRNENEKVSQSESSTQGTSMRYSKKKIEEITFRNLCYLHTLICSQKKKVFLFSCPYGRQERIFAVSRSSPNTTSVMSSQQQQHTPKLSPRFASPRRENGGEFSSQSSKHQSSLTEQTPLWNLVCLAFPTAHSSAEWTRQIQIILTSALSLIAWPSKCE